MKTLASTAFSRRLSTGISRPAAAVLGLCLAGPGYGLDEAAIRSELQVLRDRIETLERLLDSSTAPATSRPLETQPVAASKPAQIAGDVELAGGDDVEQAPAAPTLQLGGAFRLNYGWQDYNEANKERLGDFDFELFRLDVSGAAGEIEFSAQYRWYEDFEAVHHAWIGYSFNDATSLQVGISQVPFGLLPYASHSFWFGAGYYLGFEDDYDTGLKLQYANEPWQAHFAFYKNAEYGGARLDRYSFDVVADGIQQNEEVNQFNGRVTRRWRHRDDSYSELGISAEWGELYNNVTRDTGDRRALALHWDGHYGPWNVQLQWVDYRFAPANPPGVDDESVQLGAFGFPFPVAAQAQMATFNLAREFTAVPAPLDSLTCYNDYSRVMPDGRGQNDSVQNVTGCLLVIGNVYSYIDLIAGKNMWFIGGPGIGMDDDEWRSRLNINIGYYF